ncbi:uncharacterized protein LOC132940235 [Metopolophium dirhodum]|uniref:uncharacterized protein LOC132940235 n=1 Tax=Metopolophium dirhodum TaxID=44670 RepID=UPI00299077A3|nr:uncharacterized protein LOC132940235 [Metopolophium dirhodum]
MSRGRLNKKLKHKTTQANTTNNSIATAGEDFLWNNERTIAIFHSVIKQKPAGLLKYPTILKIKSRLSERLKMNVPIKAIWSYLHARWDMNKDEIEEEQFRNMKKKDFELPQTEEWIRLVKEQRDLIDSNNTNTDAMKQTSQAAISNVDSKH